MLRRMSRRARTRTSTAEQLEDRTLLSTITVTSSEDNEDTDGLITLREAIRAANTNTSVDGSDTEIDVVEFADGVTEITLSLGEFELTDSVAIVGPDSRVEIDALDASRHFNVPVGNLDIRLANLALANGFSDRSGGSVRVDPDAANAGITLTVEDSHFEGNRADNHGGAIGIFGSEPDDGTMGKITLTVSNSTFVENASASSGGAILTRGNSEVTISGSHFISNDAQNHGGAVMVYSLMDSPGQAGAAVQGSTFEGNVTRGLNNTFGSGGGFYYYSDGTVSVDGSTFRNNTARRGGGIQLLGHSDEVSNGVVRDSVFEGNSADQNGGGIAGDRLVIERSLIDGNTSDDNRRFQLNRVQKYAASSVDSTISNSPRRWPWKSMTAAWAEGQQNAGPRQRRDNDGIYGEEGTTAFMAVRAAMSSPAMMVMT